jgi:hypothetical protein
MYVSKQKLQRHAGQCSDAMPNRWYACMQGTSLVCQHVAATADCAVFSAAVVSRTLLLRRSMCCRSRCALTKEHMGNAVLIQISQDVDWVLTGYQGVDWVPSTGYQTSPKTAELQGNVVSRGCYTGIKPISTQPMPRKKVQTKLQCVSNCLCCSPSLLLQLNCAALRCFFTDR